MRTASSRAGGAPLPSIPPAPTLELVLSAVLLMILLARPDTAHAAWETQVLTAVEKHRTLPDLNLELTWDRLQKRAKITREWVQEENGQRTALDVKELRFTEVTQRLLLGLRVGLYHDLEFHLIAPIVLENDSDIRFSAGVAGRSTIFGSANADDPEHPANGGACCARYPITEVPASRERSGFGDMTFGLAWSPVVAEKDEGYPTLTLRGNVIAPTGKTRDSTDQLALPGRSRGTVGLGVTTFDVSIGLSRRMQNTAPAFDPYMVFGAEISVATPKQRALGMTPPPVGRFLVGTEIVIDEDAPTHQRYGIDLSFGVRYVGIGRTYSELSDYLPNFDQTRAPKNRPEGDGTPLDRVTYEDFDRPENYRTTIDGASCGRTELERGRFSGINGVPCGELNRVDEFLQLQSALALHIRPAQYAFFRAGVAFGVNTDHFLTTEPVGTDTDPRDANEALCEGGCVDRVNARNSAGEDERSPYYDPRYDTPGRRLRIEETTNFTLFFAGAATF